MISKGMRYNHHLKNSDGKTRDMCHQDLLGHFLECTLHKVALNWKPSNIDNSDPPIIRYVRNGYPANLIHASSKDKNRIFFLIKYFSLLIFIIQIKVVSVSNLTNHFRFNGIFCQVFLNIITPVFTSCKNKT